MSISPLPKLITIIGPTASGKTGLGIELAKEFGGEVISADSRQIYAGMNIGTAKPPLPSQSSSESVTTSDGLEFNLPVFELESIPHYLFDVVKPDEEFTVSHFKQLAEHSIDTIYANGHVPFIVGGTGFYTSAVVDNLAIPEAKPDQEFRRDLEAKVESGEVTVEELHKELLEQDPGAAEFVEEHNPRRIIRALEVIRTTGKKLSKLRTKGDPKYDVLQIGLKVDKEELERRINTRVDEMIDVGLVDEVTKLYEQFCHPEPVEGSQCPPALSGIGYREIVKYLQKENSLDEAVDLVKLHTRQFAKRQMKWFKRDQTIQWIEDPKDATELVHNFLS